MSRATIFEVGPRDGLQNEKRQITFATKIRFIHQLYQVGLKDIEVGLFVRFNRVPQMKDSDRIFEAIQKHKIKLPVGARPWALLANWQGLQRAIQSGVKHIAVFTGATDTFVKRNIGMSVNESLKNFAPMIREAKKNGMLVRGYVSTAFCCPFEGKVKPKKTLRIIDALIEMGVFQVSIGDTIGVATPGCVEKVVKPALKNHGKKKLAVHFHDTRGIALANSLKSYELGIRVFDSSAGGLGGCPFAPGATGNLATEDLLYLFNGMGIRTGVDLLSLSKISIDLARKMKRPLTSKFLQAFCTKLKKPRKFCS